MSFDPLHRGGVPVGHLSDLGAVEAGAVLYLRQWCSGVDCQAKVWNDFAVALGAEAGRDAIEAFEQICALCQRHGRRPLMRHDLSCKCLGADESCFANVIGAAAEGAREDAFLIATHLVRPDIAPSLVAHAESFGLALKRLALKTAPGLGARKTPIFH